MSRLWCMDEDQWAENACFDIGHRMELRPDPDTGWQAAIEADEARLSTSARARRQTGELAEVRDSAARAFQAIEQLSTELAATVVELAQVRAAAARNVERLAHARSELGFALHDAEHCAAERDRALAEVERLRAQLKEATGG